MASIRHPHLALIFGAEHDEEWATALGKLGIHPEHLSGGAGRA